MAWPPPALPINLTNATVQQDVHAPLHNQENQAINDIVTHVQAGDASVLSAITQLRTQSFDYKSTAGPAGGSQFAGGAGVTLSGMFVQFTVPAWANLLLLQWALSGHSGKAVANATFQLYMQMTPGPVYSPPVVLASSGIDWKLQGSSVGGCIFAVPQSTVVRFDLGGALVSGPGAALYVDGTSQLSVAGWFKSNA